MQIRPIRTDQDHRAALAEIEKAAAISQELKQADDDWERRECEKSLLAYTHAGWRWAGEPGRFVDNWHIECMCEHLEAVANRQILRLLINIPPRHYKSLGLNVFFPSWVWAQDPYPTPEHPHQSVIS